jgi:PEGA domain
MARLAVVLSLLAMASCASIVSPSPDELSVRSAPEGAQVTLDGVVAGKTPCTVLIDPKQAGILLIELEGHGPVTVKRDKVTNGWYYGNIFIGGLVGMIVDLSTGHAWKHSTEPVEVVMRRPEDGLSEIIVPKKEESAPKSAKRYKLTAAGRQRTWAKPRAQLAYLARDWCDMKAIEIARQLNRDPSMVTRLCASYEAVRDLRMERKIAEVIDK